MGFATDTARGLAFLHSHDPPIIHRGACSSGLLAVALTLGADLKSENLLVTNNWRIKLTDFGLYGEGRATRELTGAGPA